MSETAKLIRLGDRGYDELREVTITKNYILYPEGSVLIEMGNTKVICNATVEESVPLFKKGSGEGWVTAEYNMLPRATKQRNPRDIGKLRQNQRSVEIQRLIARSLRAGINLKKLGERSIMIDCDVIQADGGTRTASITGGFIALCDACEGLLQAGTIKKNPIIDYVAAISVGIVRSEVLLDLCYEEDSKAETDFNVVMNGRNEFIEVQGTGEGGSFRADQLQDMISVAQHGIHLLIKKQKELLYKLDI